MRTSTIPSLAHRSNSAVQFCNFWVLSPQRKRFIEVICPCLRFCGRPDPLRTGYTYLLIGSIIERLERSTFLNIVKGRYRLRGLLVGGEGHRSGHNKQKIRKNAAQISHGAGLYRYSPSGTDVVSRDPSIHHCPDSRNSTTTSIRW